MARFELGINYWPRSSAMAMWTRFDRVEIDEDFARIAALGMGAVRFFLRWDAFAPAPFSADATALRRFGEVLDVAHARGLRAMPALFCGHMSGVNWLPSWALDPGTPAGRFRTITEAGESPLGAGDFYTGPLLDAQRFLARTLGAFARGHPALAIWDLGNEFSNLREPATPAEAANWSATLTRDLFETSGVAATGGIHGEDLTRDRNIRPSSIAAPWPYATMHGYPVYSDFARSRLDPEVVPFLCELTGACARKPVLFSEFGNPSCPPGTRSPADRVALPGETPAPPARAEADAPFACLNEDEMAVYARRVLDRLQRRGALGAYWWCWADYAPDLAATPPFDRAPHELHFGIIRNDGSEKPVAAALRAFAAEERSVNDMPAPLAEETSYYAALPGSLERAYAAYVARHAAENA